MTTKIRSRGYRIQKNINVWVCLSCINIPITNNEIEAVVKCLLIKNAQEGMYTLMNSSTNTLTTMLPEMFHKMRETSVKLVLQNQYYIDTKI